jgi:hypothetical protein
MTDVASQNRAIAGILKLEINTSKKYSEEIAGGPLKKFYQDLRKNFPKNVANLAKNWADSGSLLKSGSASRPQCLAKMSRFYKPSDEALSKVSRSLREMIMKKTTQAFVLLRDYKDPGARKIYWGIQWHGTTGSGEMASLFKSVYGRNPEILLPGLDRHGNKVEHSSLSCWVTVRMYAGELSDLELQAFNEDLVERIIQDLRESIGKLNDYFLVR